MGEIQINNGDSFEYDDCEHFFQNKDKDGEIKEIVKTKSGRWVLINNYEDNKEITKEKVVRELKKLGYKKDKLPNELHKEYDKTII